MADKKIGDFYYGYKDPDPDLKKRVIGSTNTSSGSVRSSFKDQKSEVLTETEKAMVPGGVPVPHEGLDNDDRIRNWAKANPIKPGELK